mmetsp:Transcript_3073/g.7682  ORF Transcript_3073/g.7682 Transcript_3073/m.7682 type:complete len:387 (+) Transcript_3073:156-1316(+)
MRSLLVAAAACLLLANLACAFGEGTQRRELDSLAERQGRLQGSATTVRHWGKGYGTSEGTSSEEEQVPEPSAGAQAGSGEEEEEEAQGSAPENVEGGGSGQEDDDEGGDDAASPAADGGDLSEEPAASAPPVNPLLRVDLMFKFETSYTGDVLGYKMRAAIAAGLKVPLSSVTMVSGGNPRRASLAVLVAIYAGTKRKALEIRDSVTTHDLEKAMRRAGIDARITALSASVNGQEAPKKAPEKLYFIALAAPVLLATYIAFRMCRGMPKRRVPPGQRQTSTYGNFVIPTAVAVPDVPVALSSGARRDGEVVMAVPVRADDQCVTEYPSAVPSAPVLPASTSTSMQSSPSVPVGISSAMPVAGSAGAQEVPVGSVAAFQASQQEHKF